jgi:RNA polymerase sigma-70 factor (ECF subfamily)
MSVAQLTLPISLVDDTSRFDGIVAKYRQMIIRTAYRLLGEMEDAQDASQEVLLRLLKHQDKIKGDPAAWLYRVTVNICRDKHRHRKVLDISATGVVI